MTSRIDLHVHSSMSGDNDADPEENVLRALALKLDGIVFSEHYFYGASEPAERLREKYPDILIFRAVEFSSAEGHCLIFGVDTDGLLGKYAPMSEVIEAVNGRGGVVVPTHPYRRGSGVGDKIYELSGIGAVEGCNGCNMHGFNIKAIDAARRLNLPYTGGSDAHSSSEVGSCYTEFGDRVAYDNFLELLKAGAYHGVDTRKISRSLGFDTLVSPWT